MKEIKAKLDTLISVIEKLSNREIAPVAPVLPVAPIAPIAPLIQVNPLDHELLIKLDQKVDQIQEDVTGLKNKAEIFVTKGDFAEHLKADADHEVRIRYLESSVWKAVGALAFIQVIIPIIMYLVLKH